MSRLDRYVAKSVLGAMLVVLLVLGGLDLLFTTVDELGETGEQYGAAAALEYVLYLFPRHLYELLPMIALMGALVGLGVLAGSNELVAMQAAGVTRGRIVLAVMKPSALVMLLSILLGEVVAPPLELKGEVEKALASGEQVALSRYGHWERDGDAFMHFNAIEPQGILHGVQIFVFDERQRMLRNISAERATYRSGAQDATGQRGLWLLENGTDASFDHAGERVQSGFATFATLPWNMDLTPELLEVLIVDPDRMAVSDLYRYAQRFERQGQDADPYYLSFWKKLFQPVTTAVLVLLAISFIFGPLRESTMGSRVFVAIVFGLGFTIIQRLAQNVSLVYQFEPLLAVVVPLVLCAAIGLMMFRKAA